MSIYRSYLVVFIQFSDFRPIDFTSKQFFSRLNFLKMIIQAKCRAFKVKRHHFLQITPSPCYRSIFCALQSSSCTAAKASIDASTDSRRIILDYLLHLYNVLSACLQSSSIIESFIFSSFSNIS